MTEAAKKKKIQEHYSAVRCAGCGKKIRETEDLSDVEYVRTKRKTDIFFHTGCMKRVWNK